MSNASETGHTEALDPPSVVASALEDHAGETTNRPASDVLAFIYCSNDRADRGREEVFSRADPEEMLRSIVSQLATRRQDRWVAPALEAKYDNFGPVSDKQRVLSYSDCVDIIVALTADVDITIVIDALDECDHGKCLQLIGKLKIITQRTSVDQSLNPIKIFIATRSFTATEDDLESAHSLEVTVENNCEDVKKFIEATLDERSKDLLGGTASTQLKVEIRDTRSTGSEYVSLC